MGSTKLQILPQGPAMLLGTSEIGLSYLQPLAQKSYSQPLSSFPPPFGLFPSYVIFHILFKNPLLAFLVKN